MRSGHIDGGGVASATRRRTAAVAVALTAAGLLISAAGPPAGASAVRPAAAAAVSLTCPAAAGGSGEVACTVTVHVAEPSADALSLTVAAGRDAAATSASGPTGSICSLSGQQVLCSLPASEPGDLVVQVSFGFELPYGLRVGQSVVPITITASVPVAAGDPIPADNVTAAAVHVRYPTSGAAFGLSGSRHPKLARATTGFCGIQQYAPASARQQSGQYSAAKEWCVLNIGSSRNGGRWNAGWVQAKFASHVRFMSPADRLRAQIVEVREQVRTSTIYGGSAWDTADTNYAGSSFWVRKNTFLGKDPYLSWGVNQTGAYWPIWALDRFSFAHSGELYRVQVRFRYESRIGGVWIPAGNSGWWTVRYVQSGLAGW